MYRLLIVLALAIFGILFVIKLLRSPKFDKWSSDLVKGKLNTDDSVKDTITKISQAETVLGGISKDNIREAKKINKETEVINEFLGQRSKGKIKKEEGS